MARHQNKSAATPPSQNLPSAKSNTAPNVMLADTFVLICDWHGKLVWTSAVGSRLQLGDFVWKNSTKGSGERLRTAVAGVIALRENCTIEVDNDRNEHFRVWMWPLDDPDIALCALAKRIPNEIALLTEREKDCLCCLAQGMSTRDITKYLDIGLTTVHTHLRRSREKLGLPSAESLIGYAARHFFVPTPQTIGESLAERKRSG